MQTAVTAHLKSGYLLLFALPRQNTILIWGELTIDLGSVVVLVRRVYTQGCQCHLSGPGNQKETLMDSLT